MRGTVDFGPQRHIVRIGGASAVANTRALLLVLSALLVGTVAFLLAVTLGDYPVPVDQVFAILGGSDGGFASKVVLEWRLPRAAASLVFGAALGVSGAIFQSVTRNPLGSPDVIGLGVGAYTGALIAALMAGSQLTMTLFALAGGLATAAVVTLLAYRRGLSGGRFVIMGIAVSSALTAVNTILILRMNTRYATSVSIWGQGTLQDVTWIEVLTVGTGIALLLSAAAALAPSMRQLELGDDTAASSGVPMERARLGLLAVGTLLIALVTSITGPIAFVALVAPQLARLIARSPGATLLGSAASGAMLLSVSDVVAGHLFPLSVPVGVVTAVLGGVYLLGLILREARRS